MVAEPRPLFEITRQAVRVLCQEIGVVDTVRFLRQFTTGYGDYTAEREQLLGDLTLDEIVSEIAQARPNAPREP